MGPCPLGTRGTPSILKTVRPLATTRPGAKINRSDRRVDGEGGEGDETGEVLEVGTKVSGGNCIDSYWHS